MEIVSAALRGSFPGSGLSFEPNCRCKGLKGPVKHYDLESFETVRHSLVISVLIDRGANTLVYSQLAQYLYFSA